MARSARLAGIAVRGRCPRRGGSPVRCAHGDPVLSSNIVLELWRTPSLERSNHGTFLRGAFRQDAFRRGALRHTAAHGTVVAKTRKRVAKTRKRRRSP